MTLRTFSYGGGVQSTGGLVMAAKVKAAMGGDMDAVTFLMEATHGRFDLAVILEAFDFPAFLFSNVGDDSEHPATLDYVRTVAIPYALAHGIALHELRHMRRDGTEETLYRKLTRDGSRSTGIPIYLEGSGAPGRRSCTADFKIRRIAKWLRQHGATAENPAVVGIGISLDEWHRAHRGEDQPFERRIYPLLDLSLTRQDCMNIITRAGLTVPPKSSCWFCPFHRLNAWQKIKRETPELFDRAIALEQTLSDRSEMLGRGKVFLTRKMRPINTVVGDQLDMFDDDEYDVCESGFCMT